MMEGGFCSHSFGIGADGRLAVRAAATIAAANRNTTSKIANLPLTPVCHVPHLSEIWMVSLTHGTASQVGSMGYCAAACNVEVRKVTLDRPPPVTPPGPLIIDDLRAPPGAPLHIAQAFSSTTVRMMDTRIDPTMPRPLEKKRNTMLPRSAVSRELAVRHAARPFARERPAACACSLSSPVRSPGIGALSVCAVARFSGQESVRERCRR